LRVIQRGLFVVFSGQELDPQDAIWKLTADHDKEQQQKTSSNQKTKGLQK